MTPYNEVFTMHPNKAQQSKPAPKKGLLIKPVSNLFLLILGIIMVSSFNIIGGLTGSIIAIVGQIFALIGLVNLNIAGIKRLLRKKSPTN